MSTSALFPCTQSPATTETEKTIQVCIQSPTTIETEETIQVCIQSPTTIEFEKIIVGLYTLNSRLEDNGIGGAALTCS